MALTNFQKKDESVHDDSKLYCTHPGCRNLWSVMVENRLCSYHAWPQKVKIGKTSAKPIPASYYDTEEF